jgi:thiol:disulfide interchange protein
MFLVSQVLAETPKTSAPTKTLPPIYDENARAESVIARAVASANREHRRVLIEWGANWCPWCHVLHHYLQSDKTLAGTLLGRYELVLVDVGRRTKNMDLAKHYGVDLTKNGIPYLTVLDGNGHVVVNQPTDPFEKPDKKERGYQAAKLADFLHKYQPAR